MFQNFQQVNKNGDGFKKFAYFNNFSEITELYCVAPHVLLEVLGWERRTPESGRMFYVA